MLRTAIALLVALALAACGGGGGGASPDADVVPDGAVAMGPLRLNELVSSNDGVVVDEDGQTDDWFELYNAGTEPVQLSQFTVSVGGAPAQRLPAIALPPGEALLLWADGSPAQGVRHLPFKLPARGGRFTIHGPAGLSEDLVFPALEPNDSFARLPDGGGAFQRCRYATPARLNGARCGPPPPAELPPDVTFPPYTWPEPALPDGLVITEVALYPGRFIEVANVSAAPVALADLHLRLADHAPGQRWPSAVAGLAIPWPRAEAVAPGERLTVPLDGIDVEPVGGAAREGVVSIFRDGAPEAIERADFLGWPANAVMARFPERGARPGALWRFCAAATAGQPNDRCEPLGKRDVGKHVRQLLTPADFAALAEGGTEVDSQSVKFVIDLTAGGVVHFLSTRAWALHYTFVRELIDHLPALDRCDPGEAALFMAGWREFSDREYFKNEGRRFLMGTLVKYGGSGARAVEFARGDTITGAQMRQAFFAVAARLDDPQAWAVRPQAADQVAAVRAVEGTLPLLDPNAPFRGLTYQPLTPGVGYGVLRFVPASELASAALGPDVIIVTDDVPNDVPLVGGVVTEAFQTPLSHVSILSRNRGIPNMALVGARGDARLAPFLEKLVRLEVTGGGFTVAEAAPAEAQAFWEKRRPQGPPMAPRLDTSVRGIVPLAGKGLDHLPSIGAKAAQFAELGRVVSSGEACLGPVPMPPDAFAVPVVHSIEHFQQSGAAAVLQRVRAEPAFAADPRVRAQGLAEVRRAILLHPPDAALLASIEQAARARFGGRRFRLRSSSNTEDLPGFSGAGLYTSISAELGDPERTVADGLRIVWASLWNLRAYDERWQGLIDSGQAAMGVLVHEAYHDVERANGVCVSRDVLDPTRSDVRYINAQAGEASVTNPAPGVTSEQLRYTFWQQPPVTYQSRSSLTPGQVLRIDEITRVACFLESAHHHFRARLDPMGKNRWFAIEFEFKLVGPDRRLVIKQARPYAFGGVDLPLDCRDY